MFNIKNPALIVIDVQKGFDDESYFGTRNNPGMEKNIAKLLALWRKKKAPIIHIKHNSQEFNSPLRLGLPGNELKFKPKGDEPLLSKTVNSAFINTGLAAELKDQDATNLVLVGLTTDHCVSTTARMGANLGFNVYVVDDATATFQRGRWTAPTMHDTALESLKDEFATIVTTEELCR